MRLLSTSTLHILAGRLQGDARVGAFLGGAGTPLRGMVVGMRAEDAQDLHEEDEDPARVFALFDAAEKGRTASPERPSSRRPDLTPLSDLLREVGSQLRRDMRKLRLRDRLVLLLRHAADSLEHHTRV
jgi:hypothetical protein